MKYICFVLLILCSFLAISKNCISILSNQKESNAISQYAREINSNELEVEITRGALGLKHCLEENYTRTLIISHSTQVGLNGNFLFMLKKDNGNYIPLLDLFFTNIQFSQNLEMIHIASCNSDSLLQSYPSLLNYQNLIYIEPSCEIDGVKEGLRDAYTSVSRFLKENY